MKVFCVICANPVTTAGALTLFTQMRPLKIVAKPDFRQPFKIANRAATGRKRFCDLRFGTGKGLCSDFRTNSLTQQQRT